MDAESETKYNSRSFYNTSAAFILSFLLFFTNFCFYCDDDDGFSDVMLIICVNLCITKSGEVRLAYCRPMCIHVSRRVCCNDETSSRCASMALIMASVFIICFLVL